jgi:hypothetical protein
MKGLVSPICFLSAYVGICMCLCQLLSAMGMIGNALALGVLEVDGTGDSSNGNCAQL